jgi:hypothetical protein
MSPIPFFRNQVRGLLKIRRDRKLPRRGPKPHIGACVICGEVRMTVQAGLSDELWQWLLERNWRELIYRPDRRRYREIPARWVTLLYDADLGQRERALAAGVAKAAWKPILGDPEAMPTYVVRE